ncbi:hypothetical protein [Streptococcus suis]|uniref:Pig-X/Pbn1 n=1 Tax=Streptococcus suis R61 TaxID=996306 RepID=A0AA87F8M4_STRSU|nr:hypothetical protein [Streptococcus suis]ATZ02690.1 hypothetical protein CVO91_01235 [Streptococcus suis]EHC02948.1 hypothetical protein SSUR61_1187 [Streptococcus suis R61]MBY5001257.1 hypothetical protein [Streptococcus suis]MBY5012392.1 hypothetical protein [Streptococcus suis]MBY5019135.1 hypothetical protein [Streptococcus suis]
MKTILRYFWYQEKYNLYRTVNGFFYYLRKLPLVGQSIPESIFKSYSFKSSLFLILHVLSIPSRFLVKGLWLALNFYFASFWMNILASEELTFWNILPGTWLLGFSLWLIFVGYTYRLGKGFEPFIAKSEREFMQNFGLSQSSFLQSQLFVEPIITSLSYLPALLIFSSLSGNWLYLPLGLLTIPAGSFTGQALNRCFFNRRILSRRNSWQSWVILGTGLATIASLILFRNHLSPIFLLPVLVCQVLLIWFGYGYLKQQTNHLDYLYYCMDQSLQMDKKIFELTKGNEYTRQGLQMQAKLSMETGKDLTHLSGMTYLNALLFDRYKKVLYKKVRGWVLSLVVILVALEAFRYYLEPFELTDAVLLRCLPFSFMIMYVASSGKVVAQMVFVNCDISMLHYPFYREAKTIIAGFNYRFLQTFKLNLIFAFSLFLAIMALGRFAFSLETILLTALLLISLTALFSFHDLFIYYILQPFTKDMEVVNPVYKFLSGALYWVAYLNIKLDLGSHLYILLISIAMITYVSIGYWILLKKAPQTFRLKE